MTTVTISVRVNDYVDVEIDLDRFDTEELEEELEKRRQAAAAKLQNDHGLSPDDLPVITIPPLGGEVQHPVHEIYYAMKFGMVPKALDLMRAYINDQLGTAL